MSYLYVEINSKNKKKMKEELKVLEKFFGKSEPGD